MRLLLAIGLLACLASTAPVNSSESSNLGKIIHDLKGIEDDLKKTVFTDIKEDIKAAAEKKKTLEEEAVAEFSKKASEFKAKVDDAVQKFETAKAEAEEKIEAEREKLVEEYKQKLADKREAKKAELAEAKQKFDQFKADVKAKLEQRKAEKEQKRQEIKAKLDELASTIKENRATRKAEKDARKEEKKQERAQFVETLKSELQSLAEERKTLAGDYAGFQQKEAALKQEIQTALGNSVKSSFAEQIEEYLQDKLEKEYAKRGVQSILKPSKEAKTIVGPGPVVQAAPKASLIDQLTGKSSWETVAWVLLALCIVLALALIALIIYQVRANGAAKNGGAYERLDGHDSAPPPLGASEKQGLLGAGPKKSTMSNAGGYGDQGTSALPPSAPVVDEHKEEQQF